MTEGFADSGQHRHRRLGMVNHWYRSQAADCFGYAARVGSADGAPGCPPGIFCMFASAVKKAFVACSLAATFPAPAHQLIKPGAFAHRFLFKVSPCSCKVHRRFRTPSGNIMRFVNIKDDRIMIVAPCGLFRWFFQRLSKCFHSIKFASL